LDFLASYWQSLWAIKWIFIAMQYSLHRSFTDSKKLGYFPDAFTQPPQFLHALPSRCHPQPLLTPGLIFDTPGQRAIQTRREKLAALVPPLNLIRQ